MSALLGFFIATVICLIIWLVLSYGVEGKNSSIAGQVFFWLFIASLVGCLINFGIWMIDE